MTRWHVDRRLWVSRFELHIFFLGFCILGKVGYVGWSNLLYTKGFFSSVSEQKTQLIFNFRFVFWEVREAAYKQSKQSLGGSRLGWCSWEPCSPMVVSHEDQFLNLICWWYTYHSEKYELVSWDDDIPNIWKVIKAIFQTTNQLFPKQATL